MSDSNEDLVYLSNGSLFNGSVEYDDGELIPRSELPDHAFRGAGNTTGEDGRSYEVWVIEG